MFTTGSFWGLFRSNIRFERGFVVDFCATLSPALPKKKISLEAGGGEVIVKRGGNPMGAVLL